MKRSAFSLGIIFSTVICLTNFSPQEDFPVLKGPYFGQKPPGMIPELFAPSILSTDQSAFGSVFSPDGNEFYFVSKVEGEEHGDIFWMRRVNDTWTRPEPATFNSSQIENDMCISPDGSRLFFRSWRPLPGSETPEEISVIWFSTRTENGWSEPQPVEAGGTPLRAGYPSLTRDGTLYFSHRNEGSIDIYRSRFINGAYNTPENLGPTINTEYSEGDLCVSPDESFLIVSCWNRPDNRGESDLYISFRKDDGTWMKLENMGPPINSEDTENCPTLSPDGKYFLFYRYDSKRSDTYWIDAAIIKELKPEELK